MAGGASKPQLLRRTNMVNLKARPRYCTNRPFYSERMMHEREKSLWRRNHHGADG
jgi:hypothetical protein